MAKFCSSCGKELNDTDEFCSNCGNSLNSNSTINNGNVTNVSQGKDNTMIGFACSLIGLVCCAYVAIPGLIISIMALNDMKAGKISDKNKVFAIIGIVVSVLGILVMINNLINPNPNVTELVDEIFNA